MLKELNITRTPVSDDFNVDTFNALSEESKDKVELIYYLAELQSKNKDLLPKIEPEDFDFLYDQKPTHLANYIANLKCRLHQWRGE